MARRKAPAVASQHALLAARANFRAAADEAHELMDELTPGHPDPFGALISALERVRRGARPGQREGFGAALADRLFPLWTELDES